MKRRRRPSETQFDAGLRGGIQFVRETAFIPSLIFAAVLGGSGLILLATPFPQAWLLFFIGLYPGPAQSGQAGYEFGAKGGFVAFGVLVAMLYLTLHALAFLRRNISLSWIAVVILCLSGLGGCARLLLAIPGG